LTATAVSDDGDLQIASDADNVLSVTSGKQGLSQATLGASNNDLANLIPTCEFPQGSRHIAASKDFLKLAMMSPRVPQ